MIWTFGLSNSFFPYRTSFKPFFFKPEFTIQDLTPELRYNPIIAEMKRRLTEAGKPKMLVVGAAMRKLVHLIYGVLKNKVPFDPNFSSKIT